MMTRVRLRWALNQRSTPSRHLRTPQTGVSEVVGRGMRGWRGQTLRGLASKQVRGSRALRAQIPALESQQDPMEVGGPGDEMLEVSTEGRTSARTCCYDLM